jgi:hypothetical protein
MKKSESILPKKGKELLTLSDTEQNTILDQLHNGEVAYEIAKQKRISLMTLYNYLDQNPKFKDQFNKAQERGIKTLVEKMCVIFDRDTVSLDNNELLFIREKKDWLKFIAPRLSSLFVEKTRSEVKQDTQLRVMWQDNHDLVDLNAEEIVDTKDPLQE